MELGGFEPPTSCVRSARDTYASVVNVRHLALLREVRGDAVAGVCRKNGVTTSGTVS